MAVVKIPPKAKAKTQSRKTESAKVSEKLVSLGGMLSKISYGISESQEEFLSISEVLDFWAKNPDLLRKFQQDVPDIPGENLTAEFVRRVIPYFEYDSWTTIFFAASIPYPSQPDEEDLSNPDIRKYEEIRKKRIKYGPVYLSVDKAGFYIGRLQKVPPTAHSEVAESGFFIRFLAACGCTLSYYPGTVPLYRAIELIESSGADYCIEIPKRGTFHSDIKRAFVRAGRDISEPFTDPLNERRVYTWIKEEDVSEGEIPAEGCAVRVTDADSDENEPQYRYFLTSFSDNADRLQEMILRATRPLLDNPEGFTTFVYLDTFSDVIPPRCLSFKDATSAVLMAMTDPTKAHEARLDEMLEFAKEAAAKALGLPREELEAVEEDDFGIEEIEPRGKPHKVH